MGKAFKYHNQGFQSDRNEKMIAVLAQKNSKGEYTAKGAFLFCWYADGDEPCFVVPPGLSDEDAEEFCKRFIELMSEYAKKAKFVKK